MRACLSAYSVDRLHCKRALSASGRGQSMWRTKRNAAKPVSDAAAKRKLDAAIRAVARGDGDGGVGLMLGALLCAALFWGVTVPGVARAEERNAGMTFVLGAGSVLSTLVYGTVKTVYAVLGTVTGGLAFVCTGGRSDVARAIIQPAIRGDYVVTPEHLTAEKELVFAGRDPVESSAY